MRPGLKVLLTSGYSDDVVEELGVDRGLRLLRKPYRRRALAEAISAALQEPGEGAEPNWPQGPSAVVSLGAAEASGPGATPEGEARIKLGSGPVAGLPPRRRLAGQAR
jgi:hypothetical protein